MRHVHTTSQRQAGESQRWNFSGRLRIDAWFTYKRNPDTHGDQPFKLIIQLKLTLKVTPKRITGQVQNHSSERTVEVRASTGPETSMKYIKPLEQEFGRLQSASSCHDEKSQRAPAKTFSESPKKVLVFLDRLGNQPWTGRKGFRKNMLDGKLYYEKAKRIDQGTISKSNRNPDDHYRLCNVWFNSTFALLHSK